MNDKIIYSTQNTEYLSAEIAQLSKIPMGKINWVQFEDEEFEIQICDRHAPLNKHVIIIGSAESLRYYADIADLASTFKQQYRACIVDIIVPYVGYSTAERSKPNTGICPRGIYRVQSLFDAMPRKITFFDLHAEGIMNVGGRQGIAEHLYSEPLVIKIIDEMKQDNLDLILISPDAGRGKWVKSLADNTELPHDIMSKDRYGVDKVKLGSASAKVKDKVAVIFDDMIRSGNTAIKAAEQLMDAGAKEVRMIASHAILPKTSKIDAEKRMHDSVISKIYITNSHSRSQTLTCAKFEVRSIAGLLADSIC
jgi:ribose-phosphate pyrophosphokinase